MLSLLINLKQKLNFMEVLIDHLSNIWTGPVQNPSNLFFFFWHRDMLYRVCDLSFSGCILPKCPLSVLAANGLKYFFLNVFKYSSYIDVPLNRGDVKK